MCLIADRPSFVPFRCSKSSDCSWVLKLGPWYLVPMVKGVLKERGLMPARDRARSSALSHTSLSGGEGQMVRARRLSVNLRGAAFETPGNRWSVALPGHYRRDGCRLRLTRPHVLKATCGAAAAVGLQDTQPRGYHLQVSLAPASASQSTHGVILPLWARAQGGQGENGKEQVSGLQLALAGGTAGGPEQTRGGEAAGGEG